MLKLHSSNVFYITYFILSEKHLKREKIQTTLALLSHRQNAQKIKIIVQIGLKKHPELPDVPLLMDLAMNEQDRGILELLSSPTAIGRPIFTTPNVPSDRVTALRRAFDNMIVDPVFLADAQKMNLDITPIGGAELQKIVDNMSNASPETVAKLRDVLAPLTK